MLKDKRYRPLPNHLKHIYTYPIGKIKFEAGLDDVSIRPYFYENLSKYIYYIPSKYNKNNIVPVFNFRQAQIIRDRVVEYLDSKNIFEGGWRWNYRLFKELYGDNAPVIDDIEWETY